MHRQVDKADQAGIRFSLRIPTSRETNPESFRPTSNAQQSTWDDAHQVANQSAQEGEGHRRGAMRRQRISCQHALNGIQDTDRCSFVDDRTR
eukprot:scaffold1291_cov412-Prasinococcus_capsulatus_cf.AAC.21